MAAEQKEDEQSLPPLSVGVHPASIQSLEKALDQLRQTAQRSQFPVEATSEARSQAAAQHKQAATPVEPAAYVVLSAGRKRFATSGREASRLYNGAKSFI